MPEPPAAERRGRLWRRAKPAPAGAAEPDPLAGPPRASATEEAARRARNARRARAQQQARERKRARRPQAIARRQRRRRAVERRRSGRRTGLLTLVITLGVLIAAVVVSGGLIATSLLERPERLAAPLRVYPVAQVLPGACPPGTQGLTGHTPGGPSCYRLTQGIAIYEVADIEIREGRGSRPEVMIDLLAVDRRAFADLTRQSVGRDVAFVVRDRLVTAPRVEAPITGGTVVIAGMFTQSDATRLVKDLKGEK